ncbi:putative membrane protein [Clostridium sp. CAG:411]|jgi:uncharacterized membrane protein YkvA (DUF1232 family)|nr:YkvA family protein [Lachnospiraceae bacterium]CDE46977.1 putative membrane protein [Clostridium sp. CAG:411]
MNWKNSVKKIKSDIPALFFALKEKETPVVAKIMAGITVAYALSPIDLIPDFIPILGYLDDFILLPLLIALTVKLIPKAILETSRLKAEEMSNKRLSKKWYYSIPVVLSWCILLVIVISVFRHK